MRACVIFNPTARGEKAKRFRRNLDEIGKQCALKMTAAAGDARRLAAEAVAEGFDLIVAAGGDGTLNEVLNGIGDAPDGFERARLGVLPLGTVNVFARELGLPADLEAAWKIILAEHEMRIDLPSVEYQGVPASSPAISAAAGPLVRRYFAQLAGAGLDARAIQLVKWQVKKAIGPLAYVLAGIQALLSEPVTITATALGAPASTPASPTGRAAASGSNPIGSAPRPAGGDAGAPRSAGEDACATQTKSATGELVLIGNGRLYGGQFELFPGADLCDGVLEVCVLPRVNWLVLARVTPDLLFRGKLPSSTTEMFQAEKITLSCPVPSPLQIDGELIGHLPATFSIRRAGLRIIVPKELAQRA